jgi:hypothetical protein
MADARERGILRSRITYIILYARLHGTRHGYCVYAVSCTQYVYLCMSRKRSEYGKGCWWSSSVGERGVSACMM